MKRNKPTSCRSHHEKIRRKRLRRLTPLFESMAGALGAGLGLVFGGPIAAAAGAALGAAIFQYRFLRR